MAEILIGPRSRLADGNRVLVELDGTEVGVFEHAGELLAFENRCLHQGGPVCEGSLLGRVERVLDERGRDRGGRFSETVTHLVCPWHGWEYDLSTGQSVAYPGLCLQRYEVTERDGKVYLSI